MTFDNVRANDSQKKYDSKLPYGEKGERAIRDAYRADQNRLTALFAADLRVAFEYEVERTISDEAWEAVYRKAWEDGHAYGFYEVITQAEDLVPLAKALLSSM